MTGTDITGQTEMELPIPTTWLVPLHRLKALAELAVTEPNSNSLKTTTSGLRSQRSIVLE